MRSCHLGSKLLNTQHGVGVCAYKSPIIKWANALKESSKRIYWSQMQPLTTMPAGTLYRWIPKTFISWGKLVLQGGCPPEDNSILGGCPPCIILIGAWQKSNVHSAGESISRRASTHFWREKKAWSVQWKQVIETGAQWVRRMLR